MSATPIPITPSVRGLVVFILLLGFPSTQVSADEITTGPNCSCERYLSSAPQVNLIENFRQLGSRSVLPGGPLSPPQLELTNAEQQAQSEDSSLIPVHCRRWLRNQARRPLVTPSVAVRGNLLGGDSGSALRSRLNVDLPAASRILILYGTYSGEYANFAAAGMDRECEATNSDCRLRRLRRRFASFSEAIPQIQGLTDSDVRTLQFFHRMLVTEDLDLILQEIRSGRDGLSEEEFLNAIQILGLRAGAHDYNFTRAGQSNSPRLPRNQVLRATANNLALGWLEPRDPAESQFEFRNHLLPGGVCRDITLLLAQLLEAKGFRNVAIVGYTALNGRHASVIAESYTQPGLYRTLNYGERITRTDLDGAQLLHQGPGDVTTAYRIYDSSGIPLAVVPSQLGLVLNEMAGMDNRDWYLGATRQQSSLVSAGLAFGPQRRIQTRFYHGSDGTGRPLTGVGVDARIGNRESRGELHAGVTTAVQALPREPGGNTYDTQVGHLHAAVTGTLRTTRFRMSPTTTGRLSATSRTTVSAHRALSGPGEGASEVVAIPQLSFQSEMRHQPRAGGVTIETTIGVSAYLLPPDVGISTTVEVGLVAPQVFATATASAPIGGVRAYASTTGVIDGLGPRGSAEVGVVGSQATGAISVSGRLGESESRLAEGSIRRITGRVQVAPSPHVRASAQVSVPLEEAQSPSQGVEVQGSVSLHFKGERSENEAR
jgi:hypothetical protein